MIKLILYVVGAERGRKNKERGGKTQQEAGRGVSVEGTGSFYRCIDSAFNTSTSFKN